MTAQRSGDQKAHERQQRMEENRVKEEIRPQNAEQRKKAINDAERGRLDSAFKLNMEREDKIQTKKNKLNERSSMVRICFSTLEAEYLDPTDSTTTFWG